MENGIGRTKEYSQQDNSLGFRLNCEQLPDCEIMCLLRESSELRIDV